MANQDVASTDEQYEEDRYTQSRSYRSAVLFLLVLVYTLNFLDRQVLAILAESIQREFNLSTLQLTALLGLYFALFYSILGIPIAYLADRMSRTWIISISLFIWSGMTAVCGLAQNYTHLAAARFGVGIGEAGCTPPAQSMISDIFPAKSRATALSIYALGIPIGSGIGILLGGYLVEPLGWRWTFIIVGLPGVLLAIYFKMFVKEPKRGRFATAEERAMIRATFGETLGLLIKKKTFWLVAFGCGFAGMIGYTIAYISPLYIGLMYDVPEARIGEMSLVTSTFVALGTFFGGWISDKMAPKLGDATYGYVAGLGFLISIPLFLWALEAETAWGFVLIGLAPSFLHYLYLGPGWGMVQAISPVRMRAMAVAILFLFPTIMGLAIGVTMFGAVVDHLANLSFVGLSPETAFSNLNYAEHCVGKVRPDGELLGFCDSVRQQGFRQALPMMVVIFVLGGITFIWSAHQFHKDKIEENG